MRYLLIDKITYLDPGKEIRAIKSVTLSEDIFAQHFFGYPVLPGALLIESMAQAGTALLEYSSQFTRKALLVMVDQTKFRELVRPGDQLEIVAQIISGSEQSAKLIGEIQVKQKRVMEGQFVFVLKEADRFYPKKSKYMMETIYDIWLENTEIKSGK
jgi:3-hydroxyacyl-[acyl-carrier-protein] dehydratase